MLYPMTISARRRTYWMLFSLTVFMFLVQLVAWIRAGGGSITPEFLVRSGAYGFTRLGSLTTASYSVAVFGAFLPSVVSIAILVFILISFRKTVSIEIFYFSFWVVSLGFEPLRTAIYLMAARDSPDTLQILATKLLYGARYAGTLSLFISGIFATGLKHEKYGLNVLGILVIAGGLAALFPINTGTYLFTFELRPGYRSLNEWYFWCLSIASVLNFLAAARIRGERTFLVVGCGVALAVLGSRLLMTTWNPLTVGAGFILAAGGAWLFVSRLHDYYLWQ